MPGDYPLIIDHGEVVHIGASISDQLVSLGDTHDNSSRITLNSSSVGLLSLLSILWSLAAHCFLQIITFELGQSIVNTYDNILDAGDTIILNIGAYISNTGMLTRVTDQVRLTDRDSHTIPELMNVDFF